MRSRTLLLAHVVLVAVTGCGSSGTAVDSRNGGVSAVPTAVNCADASRLKQRALDDRLQITETRSDHERIYLGNRANFFASLAIVADLTCRTTLPAADEAVTLALAAAREAAASSSMYERAKKWGEADSRATDAIAFLVQQLPLPPAK